MKIITIVGARPQFVKAAAVSRKIAEFESIKEVLVHTGQHFDHGMSEVFFQEMQIPEPDYNLNINSLSHGAMTGKMLAGIEEVILKEKPDWVMVYGDTNSTIAGALAAKKLDVKVAHVEAGLRSFNIKMPEEINRILTDRISDVLFCPTDTAIKNLKNEGYDNIDCKIVKSGDVMYDAALFYEKMSAQKSNVISDLNLVDGFVLATIHRQENTDDRSNLGSIIDGLNEINKQEQVLLPIHPRTRKILDREQIVPEFKLIDPVGYFDIIELLKNCSMVITDSGGLQKEAYFFNKMCVTAREQTEWVELVESGYNETVGANGELILSTYNKFKKTNNDFNHQLYGNGNASELIIKSLMN